MIQLKVSDIAKKIKQLRNEFSNLNDFSSYFESIQQNKE